MTQGEEVEIGIKLTAKTDDASKAEEAVKRVGQAAKKTAFSITGSFKQIESAIGKVRKAISMVTFATMWIDAVTNIINKVNEWREKIRQTKVEAEKLKNESVFEAQKRGVETLSKQYQKLTKDIEDAGKAARANEQVASAALQATREQEDANLDLQMEQEIRGLDRSDPAYGAKVSEIRQRYAGAKSILMANRDIEDAKAKEKSYKDQAYDEDVNASSYRSQAESARAKQSEMAKLASGWGAIRSAYGKGDKGERNRALAEWIKGGGDPSLLGMVRGMKPEEIVKYAEEQEKSFAEQAAKAGSTADAFSQKAEDSAAKSKTAAALGLSQAGLVAAAKTRAQAVGLSSSTSQEDADADVASAVEADAARKAREQAAANDKAAKSAAEASELQRAQALLASGGAQVGSYRGQILENNERIVSTQFQVATGGMGADVGARAVAELQQRNSELNELLSALLKEIEQSKRVIERANQRTRNAQGVDSTEGA